jgi:hypothetical protein
MKLIGKADEYMVYEVNFAQGRKVRVWHNTITNEIEYRSRSIEDINLFEYSEEYKMIISILNK